MSSTDVIYANGVDATSGEPLYPPVSVADLAARIRGEPIDQNKVKDAQRRKEDAASGFLGLPAGRREEIVKQAGWGVVYPKGVDPLVKKEVDRLFEHRRKQIADKTIVKQLEYDGESRRDWLLGHGVKASDVLPWKVPYYLLLVGGPEQFPFEFSRMLGQSYSVGLLHFDTPQQYAAYVDSVIAYESGQAASRRKEAVFFRTSYDDSTQLSAEKLVKPLSDGTKAKRGDPAQPPVADSIGFATRRIWDDGATADALAQALTPAAVPGVGPALNPAPPAFLFSATHGVGYPQIRPDVQPSMQGALRCQDKQAFSASVVTQSAGLRVHGLIAFLFACYSAGTPQYDQYVKAGNLPLKVAERPFLAALPKALLSHPGGGALACIGHVDRAWNYSFSYNNLDSLLPYRNAVTYILRGYPVGYAMKDMRERYFSADADVNEMLAQIKDGEKVQDEALVATWAERNDAGGYVIVGDPAVCMRTDCLV